MGNKQIPSIKGFHVIILKVVRINTYARTATLIIFAKIIRAVNAKITAKIMKSPSAVSSENRRMYAMVVTRNPTAGKPRGITKHRMHMTSTS